MADYIVRATAAQEQIRAFAMNSHDLVETARKAHNTTPVVTAALGRMLTGAAMMGSMMKGEKDLLTLQVIGDGPIQGITVTADAKGHVKGFANQPQVDVPLKYPGKLDVGAAVGRGIFRVIRDMGMKDPYLGTVDLQTGEIAEDMTFYFAQSEQTPSAVGLGVLVDTDFSVEQAGGFIIQLMPDTKEEVIEKLEENIKNLPSVTDMLSAQKTPEEILQEVLKGLAMQITQKTEAKFVCDCSKEHFADSLAAIDKKDIEEMIADGKPIEVKCHFCSKTYSFTPEELKQIIS